MPDGPIGQNISIKENTSAEVNEFLDKYKSTQSGVMLENQRVFENLYQEQF